MAEEKLVTELVTQTNPSYIVGKAIVIYDPSDGSAESFDMDSLPYYTKPDNGIPISDLDTGVQTSLGKADTAYQKPAAGIPKTDLATAVQTSLGKADTAYQKDSEGIPESDLTSDLQTKIAGKADKDTDAVVGDVAVFDASGNPVDSGISSGDVLVKGGAYSDAVVGVSDNVKSVPYAVSSESFNHRVSAGAKRGYLRLAKVRGRSVRYNQLVQNGNFASIASWIRNDCDYSVSNNIATITPTASSAFFSQYFETLQHKYVIALDANLTDAADTITLQLRDGNGVVSVATSSAVTGWQRVIGLVEARSVNASGYFRLIYNSANLNSYQIRNFVLFDLTLMGIDSLTSVDEVKAYLAAEFGSLDYYPYSAGEIKSFSADALRAVGFNKWDEEWESGYYDSATGERYPADNFLRSKNFIPVFENTAYYYKNYTTANTRILFYDANKALISSDNTLRNSVFTTPSGCAYITFFWLGTTYNRDICINLSSDKNGTYEPYSGHDLDLSFLGTMRKVSDSVLDTYNGKVKKTMLGEVDLGDLEWTRASASDSHWRFRASITNAKQSESSTSTPNIICSKYVTVTPTQTYNGETGITIANGSDYIFCADENYSDAASFKAAMSGVKLIYELATPTYEVIDRPMVIPKEADSTEAVMASEYKVLDADVEYVGAADEVYARKDRFEPALASGSALSILAPTAVSDEFLFKATNAKGAVVLDKIKGNGLAWNQLVPTLASTTTKNGVTFTPYSNGVIGVKTDSDGATADTRVTLVSYTTEGLRPSHKLFISIEGEGSVYLYEGYNGGYYTDTPTLVNTLASGYYVFSLAVRSGTIIEDEMFVTPQIFDLTLMFGSGNEPSSVEEFKALYWNKYYASNAGTLLFNNPEKIEVVGRNVWDEQTEKGMIDTTTGEKVTGNTAMRTVNYIPVSDDKTYYFLTGGTSMVVFCYGYGYEYISSFGVNTSGAYSLPSGTRYLMFRMNTAYGTTYKNDICISVSGARNGEYTPYEKRVLDLTWIKQIKDTDGNILFPDGLRGAGSAYDEIDLVRGKAVKRIGLVDMGSLAWEKGQPQNYDSNYYNFFVRNFTEDFKIDTLNLICERYTAASSQTIYWEDIPIKRIGVFSSNYLILVDSASYTGESLKEALSGVYLAYELATPVEVDIDLHAACLPADGGTFKILPENGETPTTAPFKAQARYPVDGDVLAAIETTIANLATAINKTATKNADGSYSFS